MTKFLLGFFSFGWLRGLDFLPPLLLRLFLAPLLYVSGSQKLGIFTGEYSKELAIRSFFANRFNRDFTKSVSLNS